MGFHRNIPILLGCLAKVYPRTASESRNAAPTRGVIREPLRNSFLPTVMQSGGISTSRKVLHSIPESFRESDLRSPHHPPTLNTSDEETLPDQLWSPIAAAMWQQRVGRNVSGPAQQVLLTKSPRDSRTEVLYDYSTNAGLRERYRNPWGSVRLGRILEDLDSLAGTVAAKHCADVDMNTRPLVLVTASVDKISVCKTLRLDADLALTGTVTWVGRSSLEITISVVQQASSPSFPSPSSSSSPSSPSLHARFTFVALDASTHLPAPVNHLLPNSPHDHRVFAEGAASDALRKAARRRPPPVAAHVAAHGHRPQISADVSADVSGARVRALAEEGRVMAEMPALADGDAIRLSDTRLEYALVCQPQHRNTHGRIFGGFLMRKAFELAFSTSYLFCGSRPQLLQVDHVDFRRPVDIGDLLRFKSCVLCTEPEGTDASTPARIHVEVTATVTQPELRTSEVSITFYFTFSEGPRETRGGRAVLRRVTPTTEEEAKTICARFEADHAVASDVL